MPPRIRKHQRFIYVGIRSRTFFHEHHFSFGLALNLPRRSWPHHLHRVRHAAAAAARTAAHMCDGIVVRVLGARVVGERERERGELREQGRRVRHLMNTEGGVTSLEPNWGKGQIKLTHVAF